MYGTLSHTLSQYAHLHICSQGIVSPSYVPFAKKINTWFHHLRKSVKLATTLGSDLSAVSIKVTKASGV